MIQGKSPDGVFIDEYEQIILKNALENYICSIKSELTNEQNTFKGYEHCSNIKALLDELEDAEKALKIIDKSHDDE